MLTCNYIVHPATWFKVEFPDGKVVTFRPSALQPVDDEGHPLASYVVKPSISKSLKERIPDDSTVDTSSTAPPTGKHLTLKVDFQ
jgi:hypothetical protein